MWKVGSQRSASLSSNGSSTNMYHLLRKNCTVEMFVMFLDSNPEKAFCFPPEAKKAFCNPKTSGTLGHSGPPQCGCEKPTVASHVPVSAPRQPLSFSLFGASSMPTANCTFLLPSGSTRLRVSRHGCSDLCISMGIGAPSSFGVPIAPLYGCAPGSLSVLLKIDTPCSPRRTRHSKAEPKRQ